MVTMQLAAAVLAVAGVGETVLLDFQADWCSPCKTMEPVIGQLAAMGYPVRKVNIDHERALAQRFNVHSVPCFVAVVNGQEQGRLVGATSMAQLVQMVRQAGIHPPAEQVADVRGQSPDRRRRSRARSGSAEPEIRPPLVSLGQLVESPNPTSPPAPATAPLAPLAAAPPARPTAAPLARQAAPPSAVQPPVAAAPPAAASTAPVPMARLDSSAGAGTMANIGTIDNAVPATEQSLADRLMLSAVRLKVQDHDGHSCGSGTFIQFQPATDGRGGNALILTCGHVFRDSQGKGPVTVDLFDGSGVQGLPGRVVRYDLQRDIGLVSVQTPHAVRTVTLAPANSKPRRGDQVVSIGCDHGRAPTAKPSHVTAINSFVGPPNLQVAGQPAVGRSGGGLFNMQGELVGVCNFADPTDRAGLYAAVELARAVIDQTATPLARGLASANPMPSATPPRMPTAMPAGDAIAKSGEGFAQASRTAAETSSAATEIVCVVKTGDGNDAQRRMFVIENASPELLQKLASEQQRQQGTFPTKMDVSPARPMRTISQRPVIRTTTDWQPKWK